MILITKTYLLLVFLLWSSLAMATPADVIISVHNATGQSLLLIDSSNQTLVPVVVSASSSRTLSTTQLICDDRTERYNRAINSDMRIYDNTEGGEAVLLGVTELQVRSNFENELQQGCTISVSRQFRRDGGVHKNLQVTAENRCDNVPRQPCRIRLIAALPED